MSSLKAIPVGQGDAFLLVRADGKTILVDGGRARAPFGGQVAAAISTSTSATIDVVVCTHADADHAEGIIGLLESSLVPVREVWLPGRWSSRLAELCRDQLAFLRELERDVENAPEGSDLETTSEADQPQDGVAEFDPEALELALEHQQGQEPDLLAAAGLWPWFHPLGSKWKLWLDAVLTAARIRDVAVAAHHHGARIRWFDFDEAKPAGPSGGEAFLRPLNSVELTKRHALRKLGVLRYLSLSVANRESLVFLAPETETDSPVLFAADSDLACGGVPNSKRIIAVTAPHHGSEANRPAYAALTSTNVVWVRSDGNYKKRPGPTFLSQPNRVCTLCRNGGAPKQAVQLVDTSAGWVRPMGVRGCNCS